MACCAAAWLDLVGLLRAGQDGGDVIAAFDPGVCGVEDFWVGSQAVEDFAEEPFG